ncbi:hypothetical protein D3C83_330590 [compost metagenome]
MYISRPGSGIQYKRLLMPIPSDTLSYCTRLVQVQSALKLIIALKEICLTVKLPCGSSMRCSE